MVRPASPVSVTATSAAPGAQSKPNHLNNLSSAFAARLLNATPAKFGKTGPWAGYAARVPPGLAGAQEPGAPRKTTHAPGFDATDAELDPLARMLALPGMVTPSPQSPGAAPAPAARDGVDVSALEDAVRRIAWGGDRRRGVARLELGGSYEGTVVTVRSEGREVALRLEVRPGTDARNLPERLVERLKARGLTVTHVEVT